MAENYKIRKRLSSNLFIIALSIIIFADISKDALPKRWAWVNIKSLVLVKETRPHEQNWFRVSEKIYLNLCKWFTPSVVTLVIWFLCSCGNWKHCFEMV